MSSPSSRSMISWDRSSWLSALPAGRRASPGAGKAAQDVVVEEVGERPVADVVEQPGHAQRLDDEPFGRRLARPAPRRPAPSQRRVEMAGPQPGLVHHAEAVGESAVLGGREHPARALELADPAQPLDPRACRSGPPRRPSRRAARAPTPSPVEPLRELDIPVDRVADEIDRRERVAAHQDRSIRGPRHGPVRPDGQVARGVAGLDPDGVPVAVRAVESVSDVFVVPVRIWTYAPLSMR